MVNVLNERGQGETVHIETSMCGWSGISKEGRMMFLLVEESERMCIVSCIARPKRERRKAVLIKAHA